jgi:hypothetical protein
MKAYPLSILLFVTLLCTLVPLATTGAPTAATEPSVTTEPPRTTLAPVLEVTCTRYAAPGGSDAPGTEAQP